MAGSLLNGHELGPGRVKLVILVARGDMHVVMPDILVAGRLVVLAGGYAIAGVNGFQRQRYGSRNSLNIPGVMERQVVDILKMLIRHDDDIAVIARPLVRANKCGDRLVVVEDVALC